MKAGPSLAKMLLDVPFMAEAVLAPGLRPLRRGPRRRGGGAPRGSVRAAAAASRWWWTWTRRSPTSSATPASRRAGRCSGSPSALESHALRHAAAAVTVCASLTEGVKRRAPGSPCSRSRTRRSWTVAAACTRSGRWAAARAGPRRRPGGPLLGQLRALPGGRAAARVDPARARRPVPVHGRAPAGGRAPAARESELGAGSGVLRRDTAAVRAAAFLALADVLRRRASRARTRPSSSTPISPRAGRSWRLASRPTRAARRLARVPGRAVRGGRRLGPAPSPGAAGRGPRPRRARPGHSSTASTAPSATGRKWLRA